MNILGLTLFFAIALPNFAAEAKIFPKDSGDIAAGNVLPRIVQGGGWSSEIQVVNTNDEGSPMPYTLEFFDGNGTRMLVFATGPGVNATVNVIAGVVPYRGVHIFQLPNTGTLRAGYGAIEVSDFRGVMATTVLTQTVPDRPDFQAALPSLTEFGDLMRMTVRNTRPFTTVLAITSASDQNWTFRMFGPDGGNPICETTNSMNRGQHVGVLVTDILPCATGIDGLLEVEADFVGGTVAGMTFHDFGTFTMQLPYEVCCIF